jgi:hypothetical protein
MLLSLLSRRLWPIVLLGALLLGGCATVTTAPDPLQTPPQPDQSVVVVSLTGNTSQVGAASSISVRRFDPARPDARETHVLRQVAPGMARDTALYIGTLPVGEYEIQTFDYSATQQFLMLPEGARKRIGRFSVTGGKPVDLGRLVATSLNASVLVGRSARQADNLQLVRRFAQPYQRFFERPDVALGWNTGRSENDRVEEYALALPVGADSPAELPDGRVVMGARLGTAWVRQVDGQWKAVRAEGLEALLCVRGGDADERDLVAVGEFGTLVRAAKGGARFERVDPGNLPPGNLLFVAGNGAQGWFVVHQVGGQLKILRSPRFEAGDWTVVRELALGTSFWSGNEQFWVWSTAEGFAYATGDGGLHRYDLAKGTWTAGAPAPKQHRIIGIAEDGGGHVGLLTSPGGGFAGAFAGQFFSADGGRSWRELNTEFKVKVTPPRRAGSGELITMGGVFSSPEMHVSADGGGTWAKRSDFSLDQQLHIMPGGLMLAASRGSFGLFSVRVSKDHGKTWVTEFSNFNRRAWEAQQGSR